MTAAEITLEKSVIRLTRIGIMCEAGTPTPEQNAIADKEADDFGKQFEPEKELF